MKKIPVGGAIGHGYRFAFGGFLNLLRVMWLPAAAASLCSYLVGDQMSVLGGALRSHDFSHLTMPWPLLVLLTALSFVLGNMQIMAANQLALGQIEARGRWFYFSLAAPLWRMIGAFLLLVLILATLVVIFFLALLAVAFLFGLGFHAAHMSDAAIRTVTNLDTALAFIAGYCGFIFCAARFGFLLFPATLSEGKIAVFSAWTLSHRNFWRIFATTLVLILPLFVVEFVLLANAGLFHLPQPGMTPEQVRATQAAAQAAMDATMHRYWYIYYPIQALVIVLADGLFAGAQAFSYRALTEKEERPI